MIVEGKVDANSTPPKILVDTVRTEIKILESLKASLPSGGTVGGSPPAQPKPVSPNQTASQPKPGSVKPLGIKSTQPKPMDSQKAVPPKPAAAPHVAESGPAYEAVRDATSLHDDDMPPPPENFPEGWDSEWQPSFEEVVLASKPEPKFRKSEEVSPPRIEAVIAPVETHDESLDQDETAREASKLMKT